MVDAEIKDLTAKGARSSARSPAKQQQTNALFRPNDQLQAQVANDNRFAHLSKHKENLEKIAQGNKPATFENAINQREDPVQVPVAELADYTASKKSLYRGLVHKGQLFLPPLRLCSVAFLKAILIGEKKYFLNKDVPYVHIQKLEHITIKNVLDKVYNVPDVRVYLPDIIDHPEKNMNREFLFAIVNKLDPTFFERACHEVAARQKPVVKNENKVDVLPIKPDLLKILQDYRHQQGNRNTTGDKRALVSMLGTTKKRKRRDVQDAFEGLNTTINIKRARVN